MFVGNEKVDTLIHFCVFRRVGVFELVLKLKGFPSSVQDFFWFITCTLKRPSLRLFIFKIDQFLPFCIYLADFHVKSDKLINFKTN